MGLNTYQIMPYSIIFKLYSPRFPLSITIYGAAAQLSPNFGVLFIKF